jgi:hypothetical protein
LKIKGKSFVGAGGGSSASENAFVEAGEAPTRPYKSFFKFILEIQIIQKIEKHIKKSKICTISLL